MKRIFAWTSILPVFFLASAFAASASQDECAKYSDRFDSYHPERWQEVLLYSEAEAEFSVKDGHLMLRTPKNKPCEAQVYSLFTFSGDFDIQVDYDLADEPSSNSCRINAGMALQTLGDEQSYKCYVAKTPGKGPFFRGRLDRFGEENLATHKGNSAPLRGAIRVVRKNNRVSFLGLVDGKWQKIYDFEQPCSEKLRVRLKLQTGDEEQAQTCQARVLFDNFVVNSCDQITEE